MKGILIAGCVVIGAAALCGCTKKVYMIPTPQGWVEQETKKGGDKIKYKPAERVKYDN